jgi:DNA-directed RNA polymerase beta subunit
MYLLSQKLKLVRRYIKGDIITGAVGLDKETYKSGINALVLFHAMLGYVHEDAVVVSQSFADKMCHYSLIDLSVDIKNTEAIKWIAPIGTRVKFHDRVATVYRTSRLDEVNKKMADQLGGLFGDISEYTVEGGLEVPNNIDDAVVSDVLFQENKIRGMKGREDLTFTRTSDKVIKEYENTKNRKIIYDKYPEYIASDTLDPVNLSEKDDRVIYTVRIRLIKTTKLMPGSKLTNRYGGKGVVSKILPDNTMPIMVDPKGNKKTVDVVMNPYSTINRKIPSVLMENSLGLICHRLRDLVEEYKTTKGGKEKIKPLLVKYYPGRFDNMTTDEIIKMHDNTTIENMYLFQCW